MGASCPAGPSSTQRRGAAARPRSWWCWTVDPASRTWARSPPWLGLALWTGCRTACAARGRSRSSSRSAARRHGGTVATSRPGDQDGLRKVNERIAWDSLWPKFQLAPAAAAMCSSGGALKEQGLGRRDTWSPGRPRFPVRLKARRLVGRRSGGLGCRGCSQLVRAAGHAAGVSRSVRWRNLSWDRVRYGSGLRFRASIRVIRRSAATGMATECGTHVIPYSDGAASSTRSATRPPGPDRRARLGLRRSSLWPFGTAASSPSCPKSRRPGLR